MIRSCIFFLAVCSACGLAKASDFSSLLSNSPFAPIGPGAAAGGDKSVEFRGLFTEKGATYFSIYDTATQRAAWVGLNESGHPFVVRGYNSSNDTVTVELNGHNLNVGLKHAAVQLAAAAKVAPPVAPPNGQPTDNAQRGRWQANMMGPDGRPDPRRMEAFIEEMRRRRAQRMQTFNGDNPGMPVQAGGPQAAGTPQSSGGPVQPGQAAPQGNIPMPAQTNTPGPVPIDTSNPSSR
jgi:hypothetical protein